ncbi:MAG TPA: TonB-dependent receptor plug domain-containing protein, partial [Longimicrobium sp.]
MGFPTVWKGWLRGAAVVGLLCAAAPSLAAQETGTVRGRVVSSGAEQPLSGARVSVAGTTQGTVTGPSGEYTLTGIAPGNVRLTASQIGRTSATRSVTVAAGATVRADFVLAEQALSLDALVVTGTPGAVARRSVGNAVTQIDVADVTQKTSVVNVTEVLQARSPGVQILTNSGVPGTSSEIRIRGAGSFIGNQPVVYVDGVRYNIESLGNFNPSGGGATSFSGQVTSGLNGLSPNDIESIEVIKGPAAATLYGAEAAGGVIQIITKRGTRGSQGLRWSARAEQGRTDWAVATPVSYTTCTQARVDSMNALTNAPVYPGCQGQTAGSVITSDLLRTDPNALRTGDLSRYSASVRGGGDKYSFYVGGDLDREEGVFHNSFNGRRSVRANFVLNPYNTLDFAINTNYYRTHLRLPLGDESGNGILLSGARARAGRQNTNG